MRPEQSKRCPLPSSSETVYPIRAAFGRALHTATYKANVQKSLRHRPTPPCEGELPGLSQVSIEITHDRLDSPDQKLSLALPPDGPTTGAAVHQVVSKMP